MFDDLRKESESSSYFKDSKPEETAAPSEQARAAPRRAIKINLAPGGKFLGMSAGQRLALAILLLLMACSAGLMMLILAGKIVLM